MTVPDDDYEDELRELGNEAVWTALTTSLTDLELMEQLLASVRSRELSSTADECIIIWPRKGKVGVSDIMTRMQSMVLRLRIMKTNLQALETRLRNTAEKSGFDA